MKFILFCLNDYSFSILEPIKDVLVERNYDFIWYVAPKLRTKFPFKNDKFTSSYRKLNAYKSDVIFAPGNEVPFFLRGLKTQIFHGLAGEKKGHFRIRDYFDLYLTQGPYFTNRFQELKKKHKNFDVIETGWPKLDKYFKNEDKYFKDRHELLSNNKSKYIILYAPTFSPKLTSAPYVINEIKTLAQNKNYTILLKFHPLMDFKWIEKYKNVAIENENIIFKNDSDITDYLIISDLLISDTSSVVYEFLLLNKPVVTFRNISNNIKWKNLLQYNDLENEVTDSIKNNIHRKSRNEIIKNYHPYNDGQSAKRMVDAVENYLKDNKVPNTRKISIFRMLKTLHKILAKKI